jgi:hypothetical protein
MLIDSTKLTKELFAAGIPIGGCDSNGRVWDINNLEIQAHPDVAAIIAKHDPNPTPAELASIARKDNAEINAGKVVEIKNLTANQAEHYIDTNTETLDDMRKMLKAVTALLIALTDRIMPDR